MGLPDSSPVPKKDPMGMDYIAVYEGEADAEPAAANQIKISTEKIQKLGVKTEAASLKSLDKVVRAAGRIEADERRVYAITPKFEGYVERLHVSATGQAVGKGDIEMLVVKSVGGTPVLIRDIARVELAPDERRGLTELNGEGEVVSGIAMAGAALLSVTLVPVLMMLFIRGRILPEEKNPVSRFLIWIYRPIIQGVMRWKKLTIALALAAMIGSIYPASKLGSEFRPTLNEGTLLYMPSSLPGMSITKAAELMQTQNKIIKSFPEVASSWGKAGRANTATDPAPTEMFESVINLKPESEWRAGMTIDKLIAELD